jgi:hypothetical protein
MVPTMCRALRWFLPTLLSLLANLSASTSQEHLNQQLIADMLLSEDKEERSRAAGLALALRPQAIEANLRAALVAAVERDTDAYYSGLDAYFRGEPVVGEEDEFDHHLAIIELVAALNDPIAIPALARTGTGMTAIRALVNFGELPIPALLETAQSSKSHPFQVSDSLIALRLIIEAVQANRLLEDTLAAVSHLARQKLTERTSDIVLWRAIDLAVILDNAELRAIVESLAADPNEVLARGITEPDLIERTQKRAADRLAGMPALPRQ